MNPHEIKGWCPSALRPMLSGDGLVVRLRPPLGRLTSVQTQGLARLATRHGNGLIDLSNRASLQLRGVTESSFPDLIYGLLGLGLIDRRLEERWGRGIIIQPFWQEGDGTQGIASSLAEMLAGTDAPELPDKFGFAIDCGAHPVLSATSADIRIERRAGHGLICRADGASHGRPVTSATAASAALELAQWFVASGGMQGGRGRMARHLATGQAALPDAWRQVPATAASGSAGPDAGPHPLGYLVIAEFGQIGSEALLALAALGPLRLTPWRMLLIEGLAAVPELEGVLTQPCHPLRHVDACVGAPRCSQALAATRPLARRLASALPQGMRLHVSGCGKGCARSVAADFTLVARAGDRYDLIQNGTVAATPTLAGLRPEILIARPETLYELP